MLHILSSDCLSLLTSCWSFFIFQMWTRAILPRELVSDGVLESKTISSTI